MIFAPADRVEWLATMDEEYDQEPKQSTDSAGSPSPSVLMKKRKLDTKYGSTPSVSGMYVISASCHSTYFKEFFVGEVKVKRYLFDDSLLISFYLVLSILAIHPSSVAISYMLSQVRISVNRHIFES